MFVYWVRSLGFAENIVQAGMHQYVYILRLSCCILDVLEFIEGEAIYGGSLKTVLLYIRT